MPKRRIADDEVAYHEAGHAVIACALGTGVAYVTMFSTGEDNSAVAPTYSAVYLAREADKATRVRACEIDALVAMAGVYAAHRHRPTRVKWKESGAEGDAENAKALVVMAAKLRAGSELPTEGKFTLTESEKVACLADVERLTQEIKQLVDKHWREIERVAQALLVSRALTGDDVKQLMQGV